MKQYFIFILLTIGCYGFVHGQITTISGTIDNLKNDTVKINLQINGVTRQSEVHTISVDKGQFTDTLQITKPTYFYINESSNYVSGLIEPGDRINILYNADSINTTLKFKGTGNEKTAFLNALFRLKLFNHLKQQLPVVKAKKYPFDYLFNYSDSVENAMFTKLDSVKRFMKSESYRLLRADIKAAVMGDKCRSVVLVYGESVDQTLKTRQSELTQSSRKYLQNVLSFDQTLYYSSSYINTIYTILYIHYNGLTIENKASNNLIDKYSYLSKKLPGKLKVPVLTVFLDNDIGQLNQTEDLEALIASTYASSSSGDDVCRNYIKERYKDATSFKKGMTAPNFTVENVKGEKVTLTSFKGKVVYIDFWYGACVPCHSLFQSIEPVKKYFAPKDDVVFLTVSIDRKEIWEAALKKYNVPGYHVYTENQGKSHPILTSYKVASYPTTFLIDRNGNIFFATPSKNPAELQKEIEAALSIKSN